MANKAWGIGDLTETEQQPGYSPERLEAQLVGTLPPVEKIDERGFKYTIYPKDYSHPRYKGKKPKQTRKKPIESDLQEETDFIPLDLELD